MREKERESGCLGRDADAEVFEKIYTFIIMMTMSLMVSKGAETPFVSRL